jgi:hypothetical protein
VIENMVARDGIPLFATLLQIQLGDVFLDPKGKPAAISSV